jgi:hypothetical protein
MRLSLVVEGIMGLKLLWRAVVVLGLMLGVLNAPAHACACGDEAPAVTRTEKIEVIALIGTILLSPLMIAVIWVGIQDARQRPDSPAFYYKREGSKWDSPSHDYKPNRDY